MFWIITKWMKITGKQICEDQIVVFKHSHILLYQGLLFLTRSTCVIVDARSHTCKSHDFIPRYDIKNLNVLTWLIPPKQKWFKATISKLMVLDKSVLLIPPSVLWQMLFVPLTHWDRVTHIWVGKQTSIVQILACRLDGAKSLSEPMLGYH